MTTASLRFAWARRTKAARLWLERKRRGRYSNPPNMVDVVLVSGMTHEVPKEIREFSLRFAFPEATNAALRTAVKRDFQRPGSYINTKVDWFRGVSDEALELVGLRDHRR